MIKEFKTREDYNIWRSTTENIVGITPYIEDERTYIFKTKNND